MVDGLVHDQINFQLCAKSFITYELQIDVIIHIYIDLLQIFNNDKYYYEMKLFVIINLFTCCLQ